MRAVHPSHLGFGGAALHVRHPGGRHQADRHADQRVAGEHRGEWPVAADGEPGEGERGDHEGRSGEGGAGFGPGAWEPREHDRSEGPANGEEHEGEGGEFDGAFSHGVHVDRQVVVGGESGDQDRSGRQVHEAEGEPGDVLSSQHRVVGVSGVAPIRPGRGDGDDERHCGGRPVGADPRHGDQRGADHDGEPGDADPVGGDARRSFPC